MVVKITSAPRGCTRPKSAQTVAYSAPLPAPINPLDQLGLATETALQKFHAGPCTPQSFFDLEQNLGAAMKEAARQILEQQANRLEPQHKLQATAKVRHHKQTYRINKKTLAKVATSFGVITVSSFLYLCEEDGEPGIHPLRLRLGIGAGMATPALLERVARTAVDHTQSETRAWLLREHGVKWSNTRLRSALAGFRQCMLPYVADFQQAKLLKLLSDAEKSRGRHRPVLCVGRDGIMIPMRHGGYEEASTATVAVYDRKRRRLGTVYLGQMPEPKQKTLSDDLTSLLKATLSAWQGKLPQLVYVTDKGSTPDEYFHRVLKKLKHPRTGEVLPWERVLDFWHVASYIGKMAEALFGKQTKETAQWFAKMRRWLRDRRQGVVQVLRSAMAHLERREFTATQKAEFWKAYRYLRRHRRWMDYVEYRREGLPIGSGVTEAACKTVFTQRFKRSGMRWTTGSGQVVLDLRVAMLSGVWDEVFAAELADRRMPEPITTERQFESCSGSQSESQPLKRTTPTRFAA